MGFEPTTLHDLVGCSNHWATGDSVVSKGRIVGIDWNRIAQLHSHTLVPETKKILKNVLVDFLQLFPIKVNQDLQYGFFSYQVVYL